VSGMDKSGKCWAVLNAVKNKRDKNKIFSEDSLVSQDAGVFLKHPVLPNVCHYNFVHSFVTESFVRYINDIH
jgi:hypothetical protein